MAAGSGNRLERMEAPLKHQRLQTEALVIGYAMSRLDTAYLGRRGCSSWKHAFSRAGAALSIPPASLKNLRDEFDPLHGNSRKGWHKRVLRPNRQRILDELKDVSDEALLELVASILKRDSHATVEAIDSLAVTNRVAHNVAERLLTGRRAEDYFLEHSFRIVNVERSDILDFRQAARGFDFGVRRREECAIEIKGLKSRHGEILFTDREWSEAKCRRTNYWLVVVGNLSADPSARVICDPHFALQAKCQYQTSLTAIWRSRVSIDA